MRPFARVRPLLLAFALATAPALAQNAAVGFDPRTGDAWVDTWLADINRYGDVYREPFVDELVRYHGAPRDLVVELLRRPAWTPGDVYYACRLAAVVGRPCRHVVVEYERDRSAGWGALAERLGVAPGSAEFQRLKRGFIPSYDRWNRPIQLDADLERAYPGRLKRTKSRNAPGRAEAPSGSRPPLRRETGPGTAGAGPEAAAKPSEERSPGVPASAADSKGTDKRNKPLDERKDAGKRGGEPDED